MKKNNTNFRDFLLQMQITSLNALFMSPPLLIFQTPQISESAHLEKCHHYIDGEPVETKNFQTHSHFEFSHPHQIVFSKNFELLKNKYQRLMSPNLEINLWKQLYVSVGQTLFFSKM